MSGGLFGYPADYALWWLILLSLFVHTWCFFRFRSRIGRSMVRLVIGNLLVFFCLAGTVAIAAESYLRFVAVETDPFGLSLPARRWFALHTRLNSLGCRDKEWAVEKPPGVRRIAFVGDSFTYGWGIERTADRFSDRIAAMFDQRAPGTVEVMNVAKPGWDTGAELQPVKDMIDRYGVDEIVLCYVPNDIEKLIPKTDDFDPIHPPEPTLVNPTSSCLVNYLHRRVWLPRAPTVRGYHDWLAEGFADTTVWRAHQEQLYAIVSACRKRDVVVRVVLLPFIRTSGEKFEPQAIQKLVERFFRANGTPVVDLLPAIAGIDPAELTVNRFDSHPNERAHELFANAIYKAFYESVSEPRP